MSAATSRRSARRGGRGRSSADDAARTRFLGRLKPWEAAALLDWLAGELRRGTIDAEVDGERVPFPVHAPVRLRLTAERHPVGGRLRVRLYWETSEHGSITIETE